MLLKTQKETIYIAPGNSQCRIYAMPYHMRPNQSPMDIRTRFRDEWKEIGMLNSRLEIINLDLKYQPFASQVAGQMGGSFFEIETPTGS